MTVKPDQDQPLISVVVPTYNRAHIIAKTIENILAQTYKNFELIIVDDGSSDNTADVVKPYLNDIVYIQQENKGITGARNTGIKAAQGEWIALQDSDDYWDPEKLQQQVDDINTNPGLDVYFLETYLQRNHLDGEVKSYDLSGFSEHLKPGQFTVIERPLHYQVRYGVAWVQTTLIRKKLLFDVGLYDEWLTLFTDLDLFCRLALKGAWGFNPKPMVKIQRIEDEKSYVSSQRTRTPAKAFRNLAYILEKVRYDASLTAEEKFTVNNRLYQSYSGLGNALVREGDIKGGRDCFKRATALKPNWKIKVKLISSYFIPHRSESEFRPVIAP